LKFLQATTTDGKTEYFNLEKILTISPIDGERVKILMGAGLFWYIERDSMRVWDMSNKEIEEI
jgi:hypothetical protein